MLVTFAEDARWGLFDLAHMQNEPETIFGREVDLVQKKGIKNPDGRRAILAEFVVVHAA
jgi:predicted nucleotidyltransferase